MQNYLVLYYSPAEAMQGMENATKEEQEAGMAVWMEWYNKNEANIIDLGAPLMPGVSTTDTNQYSEVMDELSGYSVVKAENMDGAKELLKDHPHIGWAPGCRIEIRPCAEM